MAASCAATSAGGGDRKSLLNCGAAHVEIKVGSSAKTTLPSDVSQFLAQLPPPARDVREERVSRVACVFDPDDDPRDTFEHRLEAALRATPRFQIFRVPNAHRWIAARDDHYRVVVHAIAWRSTTPAPQSLPDHQNLERLLIEIGRSA